MLSRLDSASLPPCGPLPFPFENSHVQVLGRQAKISGFVKTGHKEGSVEIELKGHIGKPNVVIRRQLHSINEKSSFSLDGRSLAKFGIWN